MKSILLNIKPEWVAKILNGEKTIEVRKKFPKDYVGWVYLYCSKGNKKDWHLIEVVNPDTGWEGYEYDYYIGSKGYLDWCLEGKVVARFWCDKVEEIICQNAFNEPTYNTELLSERDLCIKSCLGLFGLFDYLGNKNGFAIHISKLEIFDRPRELGEFKHYNKPNCDSCQFQYNAWCNYHKEVGCDNIPLTKAPQNFCYIEGE